MFDLNLVQNDIFFRYGGSMAYLFGTNTQLIDFSLFNLVLSPICTC